jgi:hypothetical protein
MVAPDSLLEMDLVGPEKGDVVDPGKRIQQRAWPELHKEAKQLIDRVLESRSKRHRMIVTMNQGRRVVLLEVALERPVVGEAERDKRTGGLYRVERHDVSAVMAVPDPHQRFARHRMKCRKLDGSARLGPDVHV